MSRSRNGQGAWLFATNFLKHPNMLGSVIPSSRYLVHEMLAVIDWERGRYFVEYGPGVGTVTRELLDRMHPEAKLLVIELNRDFAAYLKRKVRDPRLIVYEGSAGDIETVLEELGWEGFDYGLSGIPFSTLPAHVRDDILQKTRNCLRDDGEFIVFQFSNKVFPHLKTAFDTVDKGFVLRNIPPAHCYRCRAEIASEPMPMERRAAGG